MKDLNDILTQDLPYLDSTKNKLMLILFLILFIFVFLTVYTPFNMNQWGSENYLGYIAIGTFILLLSQFAIRPVLGFQNIKLSSFILCCFIEIVLISFGIYLAYSPILETFHEKVKEYFITARFVSLVIIGPYLLFIWYLSLNHKFSSYKKETSNTTPNTTVDNKLFTIIGENNKALVAINYNQILYLNSSGNYLDIYYLNGERVSKELVRISLKELVSRLTDSRIIRIHRSFMINKNQISSFKKTKKGYQVKMKFLAEKIIPVSLSYKDEFEKALKINATH